MGGEASNTILNSDRPSAIILLALEEKGVIQPSNVDRLEEAFLGLKMSSSFYQVVNLFQKLRDQTTSYDRFLATLSAHLTSSLPGNLCDYFHIPDENKDSIISSQNPGLSLLLALDEMCVIKPSDVGPLEQPFSKFRLVQAVAKIHEYQVMFEYEKGQISQTAPQNLDGKRAMFVEFLKKKIKSWYETMTPVPWKKSCKWKSTDLFVGSGLILTDSKAKRGVQNIDEQCKLNYTEIFSHPKLKSEIRIILEGDPGAGKTMLSSQLAYDWSKGEISDVDILILLPLKIVEDKVLIQAIKEFYIPANMPVSVKDIENILACETEKICLLLDGLEEYSTGGRMRTKESSEVMKVMKKEKHSNCKVVITSRSDFAHDLPESPLLKIGRFGETERNSYIEKLSPENTDKQQKIKRVIQDNPFLLDLCSVPLLFVLAVHNIESMSLSRESQFNKVSPFMRSMILTLCSSTSVEQEIDGIQSKFCTSEKMTLGELAFNGLCKGHQQLSWQKEFMESNVGNLKPWVDSGILVLEEGIEISEKEDQTFYESSKEEERKEKKKRKRKKEKRKMPKQKGEDGGQIGSADKDASPKSKKKKKKETYKNPVVTDGMLTEEFLGPSTSHEVPGMKESHQSVSKHENDAHVRKKETFRRIANQVPLAVKFLHKVIQEWFAATFFCSMMRRCTSAEQLQNYVFNQLHNIDPTDLHYILRFTCYLHPPSCHVIMNHLLRSYCKDGHVPQHIMNCVFLCFNEHNDVKGSDMRNIVTDVCKEVITIQSEDSRLQQQAKSSLLEYASNDGVIIEKLELKDVIFTVDKSSLTLNSGVQLGVLHTLKVIEVSRWDQVLQEDDYINILRLLSQSMLLKKICCIFPSQPPEFLDEITLGNVISKDLQVEWNIGHSVHTLDPRKGKWMMTFKQPGASSTKSTQVTREQVLLQQSLPQIEATITKNSATVRIPGTKVALNIPSGALPEHMDECVIKMRLIPRKVFKDPAGTFSSNSSVVVEILPTNLTLQRPAQLIIPHCLLLKENETPTAKIFMSHHEEGGEAQWKECIDVEYSIQDEICTLWLKRFCWVAITIDEKTVLGKKLVLFTAKDKHTRRHGIEIGVGFYYNGVEEKGEFLQRNQGMEVTREMPFIFMKEGEQPLCLLLEKFSSSQWQPQSLEDHKQVISYKHIAASLEFAYVYLFKKTHPDAESLECAFKVSQEQGQDPISLLVYLEEPHSSQLAGGLSSLGSQSQPMIKSHEDAINLTIRYLSRKLEDEWKAVGRELGLQDEDLSRIKADISGRQECIYEMLKQWKQKKGIQATYPSLIRSLQLAGRTDLAEKVQNREDLLEVQR